MIRSRHYDLISRVSVGGFEATSCAETILTLGYTQPPWTIESWLDHRLAAGRLAISDFDPIFARLTNARVRGLAALRRIVIERDRDTYQPPTSELERHLYRLLDRAELPGYTRQAPFASKQATATVDAYIESWKMIIEADGRRWHTRKADFERDRLRDNEAAAQGLLVIRFAYRSLTADPEKCLMTLLDAGRFR